MVFARHKVHQYKFKHQYKDQYLARVKANSPIKNYRRLVTNVNAGSKQKVLVISGTTGVGKSSIVEDVCKYIDGELINADSVQVYKGLDIGSNKRRPNPPLTIHLLDIASPKENFNAFEYKRRATEVIEDVLTRGKVPIVVGGTGFYLQSLIYGSPDAPKASKDVGAIHDRVMKQGWDESILELQKVDPTFAQKLRKNDFYRLVRGLDVFYSSGVPYSSFASSEVQIEENVEYDFRCIALTSNRLALYKEINIRCEKMIVNGLLQEVWNLMKSGELSMDSVAGKAIGYKHALQFLSAKNFSEEAFTAFLTDFQASTRQFAHRQFSWFRNHDMFYWIKRSEAELNSNDNSLSAQTIDEILKYYRLSYEEAKAARAQEEQEALKRLSKEESAQLRTLKTEFTIFNDKSILHNLLNTLHSL